MFAYRIDSIVVLGGTMFNEKVFILINIAYPSKWQICILNGLKSFTLPLTQQRARNYKISDAIVVSLIHEEGRINSGQFIRRR